MTAGACEVVITGCGVISPWGVGREAFAEGVRAGRSALNTPSSGTVTATARFDAEALLPNTKGLRELDRTSLLLAGAAALAVRDAGSPRTDDGRTGLVVGSTYGPIGSIAEFDRAAVREGPSSVRPLAFPNTVLNAAAGRVSKLFGLKGVNSTIATGETSALAALTYATGWLRDERAERLLTGASFGLSDTLYQAFAVPLGEGAAMFVLESAAAATAERRAYGRIAGLADVFLPDASDAVALASAALHDALDRAGRRPDDVDLVITGGRSPARRGGLEAAALESAFGAHRPPRLALRPLLGECLDAAGAFQLAAALVALEDGARTVVVTAMSRMGHGACAVVERAEAAA